MEYLEHRIRNLLSAARQLEIKVAQHQMNWGEWEYKKENESHPPQYLLDGDDEFVSPFQEILQSIYLSTICYLDEKNLKCYLAMFYKVFGNDPSLPNHRDEFLIDHYWSGEPYSVFLAKINKFLSSFEFTESSREKYDRISGIQYLETILKNTAVIISKSKLSPKTESEVYNAVRLTLEFVFASSKSPRSNFIKTAKEYKPDILIPELYAAVEYKYAADEQKLKSTIEQIAADVKGYTGDRDYSIFYAVFYVTEDFWGQAKFSKVWSDQRFPKNWIPMYIVGK
ncbi:hypothetical protein QT13_15030 [Pectobacterium brasiliense]|uniref:hypothetical protein n=1 Tax=Pectobacterium TaxID=122277 RepID=UPI00057D5F8C|nr:MULTISPECIES: hypothetical protein [Pectobacterium]KHS67103.1 hypothetical protein QT13_15030 [Pectobacterium brasiliense]KHT35128.1 hypothetical protein RC99_10980 [Pectobacterium carotovorum subsp. carotovorum]UFT93029.1 hypothetical protein LQF52_14330 [Pectobacterium carotovorum]